MAKRSKTVVSRRSVQLLKPFTVKLKKSEMIAARTGRTTARLMTSNFCSARTLMAVYMDHLLSRIRLSIWLLSSELEGLLRAFW